jgi:hypothetical protein
MWKVYCNGKYIGIKESCLEYAIMYWAEQQRRTKDKYELRPDDGK